MDFKMNAKKILKMCKTLPEDDTNENGVYFVDQVIDRRMCKGQAQYLVKCQGYSEDNNTWELAKDLYCLPFKAELKNRKRKNELQIDAVYEAKAKKLKIEACLVVDNAFECGYEAEKILKARDICGQISFLIKFKDLDQPEIISSDIAYMQIPQMVLKFFELRCDFPDVF